MKEQKVKNLNCYYEKKPHREHQILKEPVVYQIQGDSERQKRQLKSVNFIQL